MKELPAPEEILELAQKVKGAWVTNAWLDGEGADFKAGILVGSEAQQQAGYTAFLKQRRMTSEEIYDQTMKAKKSGWDDCMKFHNIEQRLPDREKLGDMAKEIVLSIRQYLINTEFAPEPFTKPVDPDKLCVDFPNQILAFVEEAKREGWERLFKKIENEMFSMPIDYDGTFGLDLQTNRYKSYEKWQTLKEKE